MMGKDFSGKDWKEQVSGLVWEKQYSIQNGWSLVTEHAFITTHGSSVPHPPQVEVIGPGRKGSRIRVGDFNSQDFQLNT